MLLLPLIISVSMVIPRGWRPSLEVFERPLEDRGCSFPNISEALGLSLPLLKVLIKLGFIFLKKVPGLFSLGSLALFTSLECKLFWEKLFPDLKEFVLLTFFRYLNSRILRLTFGSWLWSLDSSSSSCISLFILPLTVSKNNP